MKNLKALRFSIFVIYFWLNQFPTLLKLNLNFLKKASFSNNELFPMNLTNEFNIVAVIVTYQPKFEPLNQLLTALIHQVDQIVIIDNASDVSIEAWQTQHQIVKTKIITLKENQGIASAHNIGILWAQNIGAEFVLLMDQDSIPALNMVETLRLAYLQAVTHFNKQPIAAGPICIDTRSSRKSFFVIEQNGVPMRWRLKSNLPPYDFLNEVSFLISSGTLINLKALLNTGGMRSNYFIDHVDTEWCFRARAKGYVLLGVPNANMKHTLGDKVKNIWFFGWRQVSYHTPLRDYYMFRNTLLLFRDVKTTLLWRFYLIWRLMQFLIYFLIFSSQRLHRLYLILLGIKHGLLGVSGKLDVKTSKCTLIPISDIDPN